jgi:hypothetical protein
VLVGTLLTPGEPASAAAATVDRSLIVSDLVDGGPSVRRAAEAALVGSAADLQSYVESGRAVRATDRSP